MADKSTLSPVKLALAEIRELRARLDDVQRERTEPIAIVGLAGRFPGAPDTDRLWDLLRDGRVGIVDVPADRWDVAAYFDPDPEAPGKMYTYRGGFLSDVDRFDPHFFGISPREAVSMDPQQRLLLETAWRALEDAAISPGSLSGSQTGVFVGLSNIDYYRMAFTDPQAVDAYFGSGTSGSVAAGRISYVLGLRGPSLAVDTACSSSLVAVHLACQSLRNQECGVALAGGVNLILSPDINIACSKAKMMSPDGLCKTFDARADGYVRSEGCAVVVLKRLSDAERDGDRILAVIRGSAVNQDGRSSGLTVPNGPAQEAVIRRALDIAGVQPSEVAYVEAHGTGTSLGDPIEVRALGRVMADRGVGGGPVAIGSIKANIGHLEAAAGIAGLAKVVLALRHETIPAHPNLGERNPHIEWSSLPVEVLTAPRSWPAASGRRLAGVSSFGFSGTNAHLVVEAAPATAAAPGAAERPRQLLTLSARSTEALDELSADFEQFLRQTSEPLPEICATANAGRLHAAHRLAVVAGTAADAADAIAEARRSETPRVVRRSVESGAPEVAFLFTGQGAQYAGMARGLYESEPAFRQTIDECDRLLATELERPLLGVLFGSDDDTRLLSQTAYAQPAIFAVEYALAQLWQSWGILPAAVLGHSVGELVAACVAGVFGLEDGLRLIAARGRLMQALPDNGAMVSVFAGESTVRAAIAGQEQAVSIAALNGPEQVVISGERAAVHAIAAGLAAQGINARDLEASRAFHSPLLDPMLEAFGAAAGKVSFAAPRIPIVSNLTGERAGSEIASADYWVRHARRPVRFQHGIETLRAMGASVFLEIGPQPTLLGIARRFADAPGVDWVPSLRKGRDTWEDMLAALATLYVAGCEIDWAAFDGRRPRRRVPVPGHPFRRQRYWLANDGSTAARMPQRSGDAVHPLLGVRNDSPLRDVVFEQYLSADRPRYLAEHRVFGAVVFPATGYLEMALAAGRAIGGGIPAVEELVIAEPLVLPEAGERRVQAVFTPRGDRDGTFQVFSRASSGDAAEWHLHATALVRLDGAAVEAADALTAVRGRCGESVSPAAHYDLFSRSGLEYGQSFRGITQLWHGGGEAVASIELPSDETSDGYTLHPGLLDSCFHALLAALPGGAAAFTGRHFYLPVSLDRLAASGAAGSSVWAHARLRPIASDQPEAFTGDVTVFDGDGRVLASISGLTAKRATADAVKASAQRSTDAWFHTVQWRPREIASASTPAAPADWFVVDDGTPAAATIAERLSAERFDVQRAAHADAGAALDAWAVRAAARPSRILVFASEDDRAGADAGIARLPQAAGILGRIASLTPTVAQLAGVTVVTRGATSATERGLAGQPLLSLVSALGAEHPDIPCASIDLDAADAAELDLLWADLTRPDAEDQIAYRGGRRHVARLERAASDALGTARASGPVALAISERGILDNLRLVPMTRRAPARGEVEIEVRASGLNFRDVLNALGMYPGDPGALGNECVGVVAAVGEGVSHVSAGDRVMALVHGGFQTFVVAPGQWVVRIPEGMDFRAAATIPMAFTTAEYSLNRLAGLKRGERVLIHAATGGVGLAAVQIAKEAGAEIFATAGSEEKRALLRSLGVAHVMNSRTVDFADEILAATGGEGVDVVLNSLTGEAIPKSIAVLRQGGRFCEIGKRGIWSDAQIAAVRPDVRNFTIFLADVDDALIYEMLLDLASRFSRGVLQPLPMRVFMLSDAASAFRHMAQARHVGKIVIARDPEAGAVTVRADATYLITGGFGGLGLRIASELADAGARNLVLAGRSGVTPSAAPAVAALESRGVRVMSAAADVSRDEDVARVFAEIAAAMPPLAGIVHAAGLRDDGLLPALDANRLAGVLAPKVAGGWNLHRHSETLALDFFVLFSSAASVLPSPAQGSYAAANGFLDALARYRRALGLPGLAINWGPWDEVGMAAGLSAREQQRWARHGVRFIPPDDGARAFVRALPARVPQLAVVAADWRKFAEERPRGIPLLADLVASAPAAPAAPQAQAAAGSRPALIDELERAPRNRRREAVLAHVREQVRQVLALEPGFTLEPHQGLRDVGMDSLMALELRNRLQRTTGKPLPATLTFDRPTVAALSAYIADDVLGVAEESAEAPAAAALAPIVEPAGDAIAIIGMGCRLPGNANTPDEFWDLLREGVDAIREIPADRWDVDAYYDPNPETPGKMYTRSGGFLDRIDRFDPHFFGISPRETISLDPQQRLLLEVAWEALEHAGQPPDRLLGTRSGVFVGIGTYDYALLHMKQPNPAALDAYFGTGTSLSVAAGRLAYSLGLQGPALAVDTACSSSLVAVHLACKSLRDGECRIALAGGVNLMMTPEPWVNGCRAHMLAPDGRCKTFDASADGYARAEGAGVIVLKRLSDALADGDRVLAVVRGTAVNQDGRSSGLTVPNGPSQQAVIRDALARAGVQPAHVGYVEAHGTGTALGDPIEIEALRSVLMDGRPADRPLVVGSVKTNIGHLEAAAGVAGLIKVVLSLGHEEIPPHLHFSTLNPHIELGSAPLEIATGRRAWPAGADRRIAGVSSFGFSGTNAHVIIEEAPVQAPAPAAPAVDDRAAHVLALSARTPDALRALAARYARHLETTADRLADVAFTANAGRTHFAHRLAIPAASAAEASAALTAYAAGEPAAGVHAGERASAPHVALLFTGQGAQYAGMGRDLFAAEPVFREALERCDAILRGELDTPLLEVLFSDDPAVAAKLNQTALTQPALFAIEYALAALWQSWGVTPSAVLGHSVGEYVAATVAGVFSLDDGLRLIAARGKLMQALAPGAMAAAFGAEADVLDAIRPLAASISIAAVNGPAHTVISGDAASIDAAEGALSARGIATQRLAVSHAFHSAAMDPILDEFERIAARVQFHAPVLPLVSNLTGRLAGDEIAAPAYWRAHLRQPVRFAAGIETLAAQGCAVWIEAGPRPTLLGLARRALPDATPVAFVSSLRPPRDSRVQLAESAAQVYAAGVTVDWRAFDAPYTRRKVTAPTYPFQRERYWLDGSGLVPADAAAAPVAAAAPAPQIPAAAASEMYRVEWVPAKAAAANAAPPGRRWIVVPSTDPLTEEVIAGLRARGDQCHVLPQLGMLVSLLAEPATLAGVIHLGDAESLRALVQALLRQSVTAPIYAITRGVHAADASRTEASVAQAAVWGLGRTLAVEHPELWGALIDADANTGAADVLSAIDDGGDEDQLSLRSGRRYAARLTPQAAPSAAFAGCRPDASYLITGGLGVLGLEIGKWLAEQGARHIVLTGRSPLPPREAWDSLPEGGADADVTRKIAGIRAIEWLGATVYVGAFDAADEAAAAAFFRSFGDSIPPLRGIVHAAAAMGAAKLHDMSAASLAGMIRPKAEGAWVLYRLTQDLDLDFFVLFSSISALIGTADLGHYAAANSTLDAFAEYRRARGLTALSVNWGAWENLRGSEQHKDVFARSGMRLLASRAALDLLGRLIAANVSRAVVADVDWNTFKPVYETRRRRPFLDVVGEAAPAPARPAATLRDELAGVEPERQPDVILAHVRAAAAGVLGLAARQLDPQRGFFELGMDSLLSVELRRRLEAGTGLSLPGTLTFKYPTVAAVAEFLGGELIARPPAVAVPAAGAAAQTPAASVDPDELTEDDLAALLASKLAQIQ
ncbi:MAG TPA: SDR family NAD(P)-dependent oxidoreductase [Vicinamibacterales bacterium]|nr:SDR family NAD(P)-dependent oxidoreductase [Vicinamibacterales bacterium]